MIRKTKCCLLEYWGDNHSPVREDGYCLHCGYHPEVKRLQDLLLIQERIIDNLRESSQFHANNVTSTWDCNGENIIQNSSEVAREYQERDINLQEELEMLTKRQTGLENNE